MPYYLRSSSAISMHSRNQHAGVAPVERTAIRSSAEAVRSRASACSTSTRTSRVLSAIWSASRRSLSACHDAGEHSADEGGTQLRIASKVRDALCPPATQSSRRMHAKSRRAHQRQSEGTSEVLGGNRDTPRGHQEKSRGHQEQSRGAVTSVLASQWHSPRRNAVRGISRSPLRRPSLRGG